MHVELLWCYLGVCTGGKRGTPTPESLQGEGCGIQGNVSWELANLNISVADNIHTFAAYRQMALVSVVLASH